MANEYKDMAVSSNLTAWYVRKSNYFYKAVFARMRTLALVLKNQNPFLNADFTKFFLKRLLNRQNGTFSIDL